LTVSLCVPIVTIVATIVGVAGLKEVALNMRRIVLVLVVAAMLVPMVATPALPVGHGEIVLKKGVSYDADASADASLPDVNDEVLVSFAAHGDLTVHEVGT
jgi:hypothetical protein